MDCKYCEALNDKVVRRLEDTFSVGNNIDPCNPLPIRNHIPLLLQLHRYRIMKPGALNDYDMQYYFKKNNERIWN